jgi:hypothetical protein
MPVGSSRAPTKAAAVVKSRGSSSDGAAGGRAAVRLSALGVAFTGWKARTGYSKRLCYRSGRERIRHS